MKKTIAIILSALLITSVAAVFTGCNSNTVKQFLSGEEPSSIADISAGGWAKASSPVITDELKEVFEKATGELTGMTYEPVAYLETQVVAGRNHLFLCVGTATVPDAKPQYSLVKIYEKLDGSAEVTSMIDSDIPAVVSNELMGSFTPADSPEITQEAKNALEKASKTLTGAQYTPIALLGTQVVAGTNYAILCEMTATVPGAASEYAVVYVYEDLQDNATITDTKTFYSETEADSTSEEITAVTNAE